MTRSQLTGREGGGEDVIPRTAAIQFPFPLDPPRSQLASERAVATRCNNNRVDSKRSADLYVPDRIHEEDAKRSFSALFDDACSDSAPKQVVSQVVSQLENTLGTEKTLYANEWNLERRNEGREGWGGDGSRRVFTEPPRISHGKINLADTHREGDWTLDAVTGHGLQRLQQIACVKERTAINGCIIQYQGGGEGGR